MTPQELSEYSKNSPAVAYHRFVLLTNGREADLFCFFEGEDTHYYATRILQNVNSNFHPISCGNKYTVINVFKHLRNIKEYSHYKTAFFIDKDFDESFNQKEVYETPCYSVENFYVNSQTLKAILKNEFKLIEEDEEFKAAISLFEQNIDDFNEAMLLFNSWYAALKEKKRKTGEKCNANLEKTPPKGFIKLEIGKIESLYDLELIRKKFPDAMQIDDTDVFLAKEKLLSQDLTCSLRGKYQMHFFYNFLQYLITDSIKAQKILKAKSKVVLNRSLIMTHLSQYAITPDCLINYLQNYN